MWDYTDKVMDHFRNPRNTGSIDNPDGVGEVGSLACGDALKLTFKLDADKRIIDAKFQTFGCASAIAASSALTEMIKGLTLAEAEKITNKDIAEYLGGLPDQKMHCSVMGREALTQAIENYHTGKNARKGIEGKIICRCFGITEEELERVITENRLTTVEQVTNFSKAGGACGICRDDIAAMLARLNKTLGPVSQASTPTRKLTNLQKIKMIEEVMERDIRPILKKDGGDIELIDVQDNRVLVALRGMCAYCQVARFTLKDVVEAKLREFVAEDIRVEEAS